MTASIEVDDRTYQTIEFAARMSSTTAGEVVARLVAQASMPVLSARAELANPSLGVAISVVYEGHRTNGSYDADTGRVDITSGPLQGTSYKTPTGAARAVVALYKPHVNPNRNGWTFWTLDDGSGRFLQSIRYPS